MSDQQEKLTQFIAITGANEDRAKFYLDSSAWQVEVAIARYYENDGNDVEPVDSSSQEVPTEMKESLSANKTRSKSKSSNFATMNTLTTSSDEEEGQAYYAGGSEQSGQQILGPPKKQDIVADMFKSVHECEVYLNGRGEAKYSRGNLSISEHIQGLLQRVMY